MWLFFRYVFANKINYIIFKAWKHSWNIFYIKPANEFTEGNGFTPVCQLFCPWEMFPSMHLPLHPPEVTYLPKEATNIWWSLWSGWYPSYWNACILVLRVCRFCFLIGLKKWHRKCIRLKHQLLLWWFASLSLGCCFSEYSLK